MNDNTLPAEDFAITEQGLKTALNRLRQLQAALPATCHADRKDWDFEIPAVTKILVRRRSKGRCEDCGDRVPLYFHHIHYRSLGRELPEDLAHLCEGCHTGPRGRHRKTGRFVLVPDDPLGSAANLPQRLRLNAAAPTT
jgi:hypothetical protein